MLNMNYKYEMINEKKKLEIFMLNRHIAIYLFRN